MLNLKKGYSLSVLIITIAVILIITTTVVVTVVNSREERNIINFIYDMKTIENAVKIYYSENGALPIDYEVAGNQGVGFILYGHLNEDVKNQTDREDNDKYYYINLNLLGALNLKASEDRRYVMNENTLRVYATQNGVLYKGVTYYTITDAISGKNSEVNISKSDYMEIIGNPITWVRDAHIVVTFPGSTDVQNKFWIVKDGSDLGGNVVENLTYAGIMDIASNLNGGHSSGEQVKISNEMGNGVYNIIAIGPDFTGTGYEVAGRGGVLLKKIIVQKIDNTSPYISYNDTTHVITYGDNELGVDKIEVAVQEVNPTYYTISALKEGISAYNNEKEGIKGVWQDYKYSWELAQEEENPPTQEEYNARKAEEETLLSNLNGRYSYITNSSNVYEIKVTDKAENIMIYPFNTTSAINLQTLGDNFGFELPMAETQLQ